MKDLGGGSHGKKVSGGPGGTVTCRRSKKYNGRGEKTPGGEPVRTHINPARVPG